MKKHWGLLLKHISLVLRSKSFGYCKRLKRNTKSDKLALTR